MNYQLKMVVFHSYVSLPEGTLPETKLDTDTVGVPQFCLADEKKKNTRHPFPTTVKIRLTLGTLFHIMVQKNMFSNKIAT